MENEGFLESLSNGISFFDFMRIRENTLKQVVPVFTTEDILLFKTIGDSPDIGILPLPPLS
jgi:hypothetical protein